MIEKRKGFTSFRKDYRVFLFSISMIIALFVAGIFLGLYFRNGQLIIQEIIMRGRADFNDITLNRNWEEGHSGVYAEKKIGIKPDMYLDNPDFETMNGKFYSKVSSTLMTDEVVTFAPLDGMLVFHVTSLFPIDPKNLADEFERDALNKFLTGKNEIFEKKDINERFYFRYMVPLYARQDCLQCHFEQGYRLGDILGGISINYNIEDIEDKLQQNTYMIMLLCILTIVLLVGLVYVLALKLMKRLSNAYKKIEDMAIHDPLTVLYNRRYMNYRLHEEVNRAQRYGHYIACIMIDIDHFKKMNDTYGHKSGDDILIAIATTIKKNCRVEDIIVRYGGEEFIIISPETRAEGAVILASRIREMVEKLEVKTAEGDVMRITASLGVAEIKYKEKEKPDNEEEIIELADRALYIAKANGRNRVEVFEKSV
jgi:diguanylate cyclase (GGDEF)-like protein